MVKTQMAFSVRGLMQCQKPSLVLKDGNTDKTYIHVYEHTDSVYVHTKNNNKTGSYLSCENDIVRVSKLYHHSPRAYGLSESKRHRCVVQTTSTVVHQGMNNPKRDTQPKVYCTRDIRIDE